MNAIDQYVAPPPPRPNPQQPAQAPRAGSDTSGNPTFGDVYNKAANGNQSDNASGGPKDASSDEPAAHAGAQTADNAGKAEARGEKKPATVPGAASAIFTLAAESEKTSAKDKAFLDDPAKMTEGVDPLAQKQDTKGKTASTDPEKLLAKQAENAQAQAEAQVQTPETDAAAIALKLLGAEVVAKGETKKAPTEPAETEKEPAKDKATDAKADATAKTADAANALAAAALVVQAAGGQPKDQQEQGKPKSDETQAKTIDAVVIQTKGPATTDDTGKTSSSGDAVKPESITVLDARRFVGSGEVISANTQAVMSGVTGDGDWAAAMKAASAAASETHEPRTGTPVNTLKIQMTPESLGNVTATLRLHGDQLTVHLSVESGEAFKQLSHDKEGLIQSLKSQGFTVDQVSVQLAPTPTTDKTVAQTSSGQQTGGQMQDGSSAGQFAQQGREQDNNRRQQDNGFNANWQGDDKSVAAESVAAPSDTVRAGQVYL